MNKLNYTEQDIKSFVWKRAKKLDENKKYIQDEVNLVDMNQSELKDAYTHCKTMLFNNDYNNPGRYNVLSIISDQKNRCGAELFLRYMNQEKGFSRISLVSAINEFLQQNKEALSSVSTPSLDVMFKNLPDEFKGVPLDLIIDACLDRLGVVNVKHITRSFILRQGIWWTASEALELDDTDIFGKPKDKLEIVRERLNLKEIEKLNRNPKGLNFTEMKAILSVKPNKKFRDLAGVQLEVLRNKILFVLEETVRYHINSWEERMLQIEAVVAYKGFKI